MYGNNPLYSLVGFIIAITVVVVAYIKWRFMFWKRHGFPSTSPSIPFGDATTLALKKESIGQVNQRIYTEAQSRNLRHIGAYAFTKPIYMPRDPEIIKSMLLKDSSNFTDKRFFHNERYDPLSAHLFAIDGEKWRTLRQKLTPTFTTGQLKNMFQTLIDCSKNLTDYLDQHYSEGILDIKDVLARFTTDIIGSCAFGIECNCLQNPDADFRKYGKLQFDETDFIETLRQLLVFGGPTDLMQALGLRIVKPKVSEFFLKAVKDTVDHRESNNIYRKDFMHLMLQLKNRGMLSNDGKIFSDDGEKGPTTLTFNELAAQAFVFYIGGFETSSTAMTFAVLELAQNQSIQDKTREEITRILKKYNGEVSYESLKEMVYVQRVLDESMRKYPPLPQLDRNCRADYKIPNSDLILPKDAHVIISLAGLQNDPEYYPNPEVFDPDRFTEENKKKRPPCTFLPFGEGPRVCIGMRFGSMQSKLGLVTLLKDYIVHLHSRTRLPVQIDPHSIFTSVEGGVWVTLEKLQN